MLGHRELGIEDYLNILRRRMWWIIVPAAIMPLIAFGISLRLQNRFTSQTLVLVEHQKVPDQYVTPVVTEMINARLATMQEQILSRTRLQPIIERFGLFADQPNKSMEEKVEMMRKAVSVSPVRADFSGTAGGLPGFYVSFTASNARLAQQVCGEITSMFMQENLKIREQSAQGTTDFIRSQLDDAKRSLDEQDAKLAKFKQQYVGQLPGQEQSNFSMLATLNTQLEAMTQALTRLQQDRTYTDSMLSQQLDVWRGLRANRSAQTPQVAPELLQQQLQSAEAQLVALQQKYTDTHPDVIKAKKNVAVLQAKIDEAANRDEKQAHAADSKDVKAARPEGPEPLAIQQLRAQLHGMDVAIKDKQAAQAELQRQIKAYEARIQLSPVVEEKYKQLTRDYQTALEFYNQLLNKKNQSEMATDLERRQQGEQFQVLDPPNLPEKPTFPNRPMFAGGGLAAGLALGLGMALLLEFRDKSIRTEQDVEFYLKLPTLVLIPSIGAGEIGPNGNGSRWRWWNRKKKVLRIEAINGVTPHV